MIYSNIFVQCVNIFMSKAIDNKYVLGKNITVKLRLLKVYHYNLVLEVHFFILTIIISLSMS